jgi:hypothetical protein
VEGAFIGELIAGVLYLVVGVPLVLRGRRTRGVPERFLGSVCLLIGVSYVLYETPFALDVGSLALPLTFAGRLVFDAAMVVVALFNRRFFHGIGAALLVGATALLLLSGLVLSALSGDWDGYAPLGNAGFWLEWSGQVVPFVWLSVEAGVQWTRARRRAPLGLVDPMSAHRFLLWSLFALLQLWTRCSGRSRSRPSPPSGSPSSPPPATASGWRARPGRPPRAGASPPAGGAPLGAFVPPGAGLTFSPEGHPPARSPLRLPGEPEKSPSCLISKSGVPLRKALRFRE